ncbi:MAG: glycosyltransferase family 2 protein [Methylobacter sp.]
MTTIECAEESTASDEPSHSSCADSSIRQEAPVNVTVVLPTFNSAAFIEQTIASVLGQTLAPYEILVLDDGSTDDTIAILDAYRPRITVLAQKNRGVAHARSSLCRMASGELIAFIDHDDLWHPRYLEVQCKLFRNHPSAVATFTGHLNIFGLGAYSWKNSPSIERGDAEILRPKQFLLRYNRSTGDFASMSYCCLPKKVLDRIGLEPFCAQVSGADDFFLFNLLPLFGDVIYAPVPLVAYRVLETAQSADRLKSIGLAVRAFEILERHYSAIQDPALGKIFDAAFASKRRYYAKALLGAGRKEDARRELRASLRLSAGMSSLAKSLGLSLLSWVPTLLDIHNSPSQRVHTIGRQRK